MRDELRFRNSKGAQAAVFMILAFGLICLLCGFSIDSGLLYLAKARLSRAVDGAALAAVGNFNLSTNPVTNRDSVALLMRNFAIANYLDLSSVGSTISVSGGTPSSYTTPQGQTGTQYTYLFYDPTAPAQDPNGAYRRYVQIVLQTGAGGQVTSGQCNARCPVKTYFLSYLGGFVGWSSQVAGFQDLKVSSTAVATRNPRLIMVVVDRSASMLASGGGAFGLPAAITTFLNFFDTSSDYVGIVSFSSAARLEMPLTTNFLNAGTNDLYDSYQIDANGSAVPGIDPEEQTNSSYASNGPRRLKFGGQTAADEGLRMGLEQLMQNPGFSNPNVVKYIVLFTDGAWNTARTMVAAPGYTNVVVYPTGSGSPNQSYVLQDEYTNYVLPYTGVTNFFLPVPTLSPFLAYSNSVTFAPDPYVTPYDNLDHTNDVWQSIDGAGQEPLEGSTAARAGNSMLVNNTTNYLVTLTAGETPLNPSSKLDVYSPYLNVWLPPGSVDYVYTNSVVRSAYVSDYTNPTNTVNVSLYPGESNVLVVPGYVADGVISDVLDLEAPDNAVAGISTSYPRYREDNFNQPFMWPDDGANDGYTNTASSSAINSYVYGLSGSQGVLADSFERGLMFRNYANLLTGFYVFRPDDPMGTNVNSFTGALMPLDGNGPYYPSSAIYWPYDLVGVDPYVNYSLINPLSDPDSTDQGNARRIAYSINMLSSNAAPEYAGELFYQGTQGSSVYSGATAVTTQITSSSQWQVSVPDFVQPLISAGVMTNEPSHYSGSINGAIWRPLTFNGSNNYVGSTNGVANLISLVSPDDSLNKTGGYVTDGKGNIYRNTMAYSGRPTHYYDFSQSKWVTIPDNHVPNTFVLPLGNWKAREYAWHARALGVTIYTVGYGTQVSPAEQVLLAQVANATNSTANPATNLPYNPSQPIGQQFYASTTNDISNDFYQVGTAINGALTQ
jgi:hypothetical protein